ncbi:MAG: cupin domain-containing protein [Actinomycetota bacterium]
MRTRMATDGPYERGDEARFSGEVWIGPRLSGAEGNAHLVSFAPGARTRWHSHPGGQFLYAVTGRGLVGSRREGVRPLGAGDSVYAAQGEVHWHGGAPDAPLVHFAVNVGGDPEWLGPVTDEEYAG